MSSQANKQYNIVQYNILKEYKEIQYFERHAVHKEIAPLTHKQLVFLTPEGALSLCFQVFDFAG